MMLEPSKKLARETDWNALRGVVARAQKLWAPTRSLTRAQFDELWKEALEVTGGETGPLNTLIMFKP